MWLVIHKNGIGKNNWLILSGPVKIWTDYIWIYTVFSQISKTFFEFEFGDESIE